MFDNFLKKNITKFKKNITKSNSDTTALLSSIQLPTISIAIFDNCKSDVTEENCLAAPESVPNNKTPRNVGFSKEFYKTFWGEIKYVFLISLIEAKEIGPLIVLQRQAIIKLLEKKDREKTYVKNWRPISFLNINAKMIFEAFAGKLRKIFPSFISQNQTAYDKNRCKSESCRLVANIIEVCDNENIPGYLVTIDIVKVDY